MEIFRWFAWVIFISILCIALWLYIDLFKKVDIELYLSVLATIAIFTALQIFLPKLFFNINENQSLEKIIRLFLFTAMILSISFVIKLFR